MQEKQSNCLSCKFTVVKTGGYLNCQRFPQQVRVTKDYVCGEWRPDLTKETKSANDKKSSSK